MPLFQSSLHCLAGRHDRFRCFVLKPRKGNNGFAKIHRLTGRLRLVQSLPHLTGKLGEITFIEAGAACAPSFVPPALSRPRTARPTPSSLCSTRWSSDFATVRIMTSKRWFPSQETLILPIMFFTGSRSHDSQRWPVASGNSRQTAHCNTAADGSSHRKGFKTTINMLW